MRGFDVVWIIDRLWLNPESYLNLLLTVLPERFAAVPLAVTDDLMPWNQEMQRAFLPNSSDADH